MNQVELLRHVANNIEAGRPSGHGLLFDGKRSDALTPDGVLYDRPLRYSLAPRTRMINGVECPMPIEVEPGNGERYWTEAPYNAEYAIVAVWGSYNIDRIRLERGICYPSKEAAIVSCKARYGFTD